MLQNNPFYILNIPMNAGKSAIVAASEAALLKGSKKPGDESEGAFSVLVNPDQRLAAELDWFPGLEEEKISEICRAVRSTLPIDEQGLSGVALLNAGLYNLGLMTMQKGGSKKNFIQSVADAAWKIAELYDNINVAELTDAINVSRQQAGITPADLVTVFSAWQDRKSEISKIIDNALKNCRKDLYIQIFSKIADDLTGENALPMRGIINDAIDWYEINTYAEAGQLAYKIREQRDRIKGCSSWNKIVTGNARSWLLKAARKWRDIAKPMLVRADLFGAEYEWGKLVADYALDASVCINSGKTFDNHELMSHEMNVSMSYILGKNRALAEPFKTRVTNWEEHERKRSEALKQTGCYKICVVIVIIMIVGTLGSFVFGYLTSPDSMKGSILIGMSSGLLGLAIMILIPYFIAKNKHRKDK